MEKYTLEEFEKMFDEAQRQAIKNMIEDMNKVDSAKKMNDMHKFVFSMQNMLFGAEIKRILFGKEK